MNTAMKSTFKKLILAATLLLPLAFTSCGSDSDDEPEQITVTKSEIQGEWFNMSGGVLSTSGVRRLKLFLLHQGFGHAGLRNGSRHLYP